MMCYICEKKIDGYEHFSKCSTFTFDQDIIDNTDIRDPTKLGVPAQRNMPREADLLQNTTVRSW